MRSQFSTMTNRSSMTGQSSAKIGQAVRAFAPGGIGNLGPGLDILGCAVTGLGDTVEARFVDAPGLHLAHPGHADLPIDPARNAATIAAREVIRRAGGLSRGVALR